MKKLNIYFNKKYLSDNKKCEGIFYPFIEPLASNPNDPDFNRFDEYIASGKDYFNVSDNMADSDLAIWPESWAPNNDNIKEFLEEVEKYQKPAVFFFYNDSTEKINVGKHFLFRPSLYRSSRVANEFAVPGVSEDFVKNYFNGNLPIKEKEAKPIVGYCGYATESLWFSKLKKIFTRSDGWLVRSRAIKNISKNSEIISNFIIRRSFWGGIYQKGPQY